MSCWRAALGVVLLTVASCDGAASLELGRRIYHEGVGTGGLPVRACVGEPCIPLEGAAARCAGCHGDRGAGSSEAAVVAPALTSRLLLRPARDSLGGPRRPAYDERTLLLAISTGHGAGGILHWAMPRFALTQAELSALSHYLEVIEDAPEPGVDDRRLRVGLHLPTGGPRAALSRLVRSVLVLEAEEANRAGGYFGRRLELVTEHTDYTAETDDVVAVIELTAKVEGAVPSIAVFEEEPKGPPETVVLSAQRAARRLDAALRRAGADLSRQSLAIALATPSLREAALSPR